MQKKAILGLSIVATVILLGAASSYFSPYWTIYQMKRAYDRRDAAAFSAYIDFPSLRTSVKAQMQAGLREKLEQRLHGSLLANLGAALAANVTDPVVEALVSPESVAQAFRNAGVDEAAQNPALAGSAAASNPDASSAITATPPAPEADRHAHYAIHYRDASTVAASTLGGMPATHLSHNPLWSSDNTFVFKRAGLWSWQLAAIEFPPGTFK